MCYDQVSKTERASLFNFQFPCAFTGLKKKNCGPSSLHHGLIALLKRELGSDSAFIQPVGFGPDHSSKPELMPPSGHTDSTQDPRGSCSRRDPPTFGIFRACISAGTQVDVCFWRFWMQPVAKGYLFHTRQRTWFTEDVME